MPLPRLEFEFLSELLNIRVYYCDSTKQVRYILFSKVVIHFGSQVCLHEVLWDSKQSTIVLL